MKKLLRLLLIFCLVSCSSLDDETPDIVQDSFDVNINTSQDSILVGDVLEVMFTANEEINRIQVSYDGGITYETDFTYDFGSNTSMFFEFSKLGNQTLMFKIHDTDNTILDKEISTYVERGNAIQITGLNLFSFFNQGGVWDQDLSGVDELADLQFVLMRPNVNILTGNRYQVANYKWVWYTSAVKMNESNLNWNVQNDEVYHNLSISPLYIAFLDYDTEIIKNDLMMGPPYYREIPFSNFVENQPESIYNGRTRHKFRV